MVVRSGTGTSDIAGVFHGDNEIDAIYHGTTNVYTASRPRLYIINDRNDTLRIASEDLLSSERIGSLTNFGVGENRPSGLASHDGNLYMVGVANDVLYTINTDTGRATRVGTSNNFGLNIVSVSGLFSYENELVTVDSNHGKRLLRINPSTGAGIGFVDASGIIPRDRNFDVSGITGGTVHKGSIYLVGSGLAGGSLFRVTSTNLSGSSITADRLTTRFTVVGGGNVAAPESLASNGENLYLISHNGNFYTVSTTPPYSLTFVTDIGSGTYSAMDFHQS